MSEMTESEIIAFMKVLKIMRLRDEVILFITASMEDNPDKADKMIAYIKENPNVSESDLLKKTQEICKL